MVFLAGDRVKFMGISADWDERRGTVYGESVSNKDWYWIQVDNYPCKVHIDTEHAGMWQSPADKMIRINDYCSIFKSMGQS